MNFRRLVILASSLLVLACSSGRVADENVYVCAVESSQVDQLVAVTRLFALQSGLSFNDRTEEMLRNREIHKEGGLNASTIIDDTTPKSKPTAFTLESEAGKYPFVISNFGLGRHAISISYFMYPKEGYDELFFREFLNFLDQEGISVSFDEERCS